MQLSEKRILTTHVGSLPRNPKLTDLLLRQERGEPMDPKELERESEAAVKHVVERQIAAGVDVLNDGEQPRVGFQTYVPQRMKGFGGESKRPPAQDMVEFPAYVKLLERRGMLGGAKVFNAPQAIGPLSYDDLTAVRKECDMFEGATKGSQKFAERFMTAAAPGIIATTMLNAYFDTYDKYVLAVAEEIRKEYEYIVSRGLILQLDAPDLAMERTFLFQDKSVAEFVKVVELHIEAVNRAVKNIPPEKVRLHICWGNYDGPHMHDVPLEDILPAIYKAKVGALAVEGANPAHAHEYKVFKKLPPPAGMAIIPGVIDSTSCFVEHPEVVADRICRVAEAVGDRTRVIAGSDCGFGTFAAWEMVPEDIVWAKLATLRKGADLATKRLWG
ncbi:MAG TPA: cobalamin-independent methionine synthase II family protein [Candidatus Binataceae bacterium]|nr:cobalamin-independent methionine synthase II family protein [Candidatus Binataceae bacterium]